MRDYNKEVKELLGSFYSEIKNIEYILGFALANNYSLDLTASIKRVIDTHAARIEKLIIGGYEE